MDEHRSAAGVAKAQADFQLSRPFARGLRHAMTAAQIQAIHALIYNGALQAIEAWEKGRASREAAAFYEGKSGEIR